MNLKSLLSGFIASLSFVLIFLSIQQYSLVSGYIEKYPLYIMIGAFALFMFRDRILDKFNIHNGG